TTVKFKVVNVGTEYRLGSAPPPNLMLGDDGLQELYSPRVIYFWDQADAAVLVPDQRYLPKLITKAKQPAEVVRWLTAGPSPWLQPALQALPDLEVKDASYIEQGRLVVNLSSKAATLDKETLHRLATQLDWSASPAGGVELRIEGTPTGVPADDFSVLARSDDNGEPERF